MDVANIKQFTNGWFIGAFDPAMLKTNQFEIAHHFYPKGFRGTPHTHKIATEYNYIVTGKLVANGKDLMAGEFFIFNPYEVANVEFLEDTNLIIVKTPSVPGDKYEAK